MGYDPELGDRLRAALSTEAGVSEKRMFGGLAFLVGGRMAVAAGGHGGLMLRVDPSDPQVDDDPRVGPQVMRGREMAGWRHVDVDGSVSGPDLEGWVAGAVALARALPPS
jgi:hypothetical protein